MNFLKIFLSLSQGFLATGTLLEGWVVGAAVAGSAVGTLGANEGGVV